MEKTRFSKTAVLSGILAFSSIMIALACFVISYIGIIILLPSILLAILFSILGLYSIKKSKGLLKGKVFSVASICVSVVLLVVFIYGAVQLKGTLNRILCSERLYGLWQCLIRYSENNNANYPPPDSWCDSLKEQDCSKIYFTCPTEKNILCSYAMNPNVNPNSPHDIVLLFESIPGWNQSGESELIDANNHIKEGANVLFNGGYVEFITPKDFNKLKWHENSK